MIYYEMLEQVRRKKQLIKTNATMIREQKMK